jgi:hypothetical protein
MTKGRRLSCLVVLLVFACACSDTGGAASGPADGASYQELVKAARYDPASVDFTQLRTAWTRSQEYDPFYRDSAEFTELFNALQAIATSEEAPVESPCTAVPNQLFTDTLIHLLCANLAGATGDLAAEEFHGAVLDGLLRSIGGNGGMVRGSREITVVSAYEQAEYLRRSPFTIVEPLGDQAAQADTVVVVNEDGERATLRFREHPQYVSHKAERHR